uniref:Uncharacterized protein n=1 Tax=viral metagenome TaxID=1070528 RepID=A0A6C0LI53_9ZZZZ
MTSPSNKSLGGIPRELWAIIFDYSKSSRWYYHATINDGVLRANIDNIIKLGGFISDGMKVAMHGRLSKATDIHNHIHELSPHIKEVRYTCNCIDRSCTKLTNDRYPRCYHTYEKEYITYWHENDAGRLMRLSEIIDERPVEPEQCSGRRIN